MNKKPKAKQQDITSFTVSNPRTISDQDGNEEQQTSNNKKSNNNRSNTNNNNDRPLSANQNNSTSKKNRNNNNNNYSSIDDADEDDVIIVGTNAPSGGENNLSPVGVNLEETTFPESDTFLEEIDMEREYTIEDIDEMDETTLLQSIDFVKKQIRQLETELGEDAYDDEGKPS